MADLVSILYEDLDEEVLDKMPEWFKVLRESWFKITDLNTTKYHSVRMLLQHLYILRK